MQYEDLILDLERSAHTTRKTYNHQPYCEVPPELLRDAAGAIRAMAIRLGLGEEIAAFNAEQLSELRKQLDVEVEATHSLVSALGNVGRERDEARERADELRDANPNVGRDGHPEEKHPWEKPPRESWAEMTDGKPEEPEVVTRLTSTGEGRTIHGELLHVEALDEPNE